MLEGPPLRPIKIPAYRAFALRGFRDARGSDRTAPVRHGRVRAALRVGAYEPMHWLGRVHSQTLPERWPMEAGAAGGGQDMAATTRLQCCGLLHGQKCEPANKPPVATAQTVNVDRPDTTTLPARSHIKWTERIIYAN